MLKVVYLLFTEGYQATAGPQVQRPQLAGEAIRLGYLGRRCAGGSTRRPGGG
jgi:RNA polymerase sigma-70 factor (ECF subfamily)